MKEYKIIVLGNDRVGKSALAVQFISGIFIGGYNPTIEDVYRKEIHVGNNPCIIEVFDTSGTENFSSMRDLYIKNCQAALLIYSIVEAQSFVDVQLYREEMVAKTKGRNTKPVVLVGNMCDMEDKRVLTSGDGTSLAADWDCPFYETSAKTGHNVEEAFHEAVKLLIRRNQADGSTDPAAGNKCCTVL